MSDPNAKLDSDGNSFTYGNAIGYPYCDTDSDCHTECYPNRYHHTVGNTNCYSDGDRDDRALGNSKCHGNANNTDSESDVESSDADTESDSDSVPHGLALGDTVGDSSDQPFDPDARSGR